MQNNAYSIEEHLVIRTVSGVHTFGLASPSLPNTLAIMLDLLALGENPSQGGTKISFVHWT